MTSVGLLYVMVLLFRKGCSRITRYLSGLSLVGIITVLSPQYASSAVRDSAYRITYVQDRENESVQEDPWASPASEVAVTSLPPSTSTQPTLPTISTTSPTSTLSVNATSTLPLENTSESQSDDASRTSSPKTESPRIKRESYRVVAGDNLWTIARAHIRPGESVDELWKTIIAENISTLRSKNPNLIYPGEEIILSHHQ